MNLKKMPEEKTLSRRQFLMTFRSPMTPLMKHGTFPSSARMASALHTSYWLRVFPPPEFVWKPLWVCLSPVSGEFVRIRFLWRSIWREVSSGKGFQ
jgi:hypothetical protein